MKTVKFGKNEVVFREGDMGRCFYQIEEGTAGIYLHYGEPDQKKLTDMKPGEYVGEMSVIEAWPRSSTVVAEDDLTLIEIGEDSLNEYFREQPDKIFALMKQLGGRIRTLTAEYDEVKTFIEEKKAPEAEKKEGFLARLRKYIEDGRNAEKLAALTEEEITRKKVSEGKTVGPVSEYLRGQIIFREGDAADSMYAIHGGEVGIYLNYGTDQEKRIANLFSDEFFGEMGMIENEPRSATAVVEMDGTVLECIKAEDLEKLFDTNPAKVSMILSHLSHRLRKLTVDYSKACKAAAE